MPVFAYRARDNQGRLAEGTLDVPTEDELAQRLNAQGLLLTTVRRVGARNRGKLRRGRLSRKELVTLTYNLETIYSSGIPLVEGLLDLSSNAGDRRTSQVAAGLAEDIRGGASLAEAMERRPQAFPNVYRSVVKAGESAGEPGPVLKRLANYYQWLGEMKSTALRALTYPLLLGASVCGLIVLLLTFLVPRIMKVLVRSDMTMPLPTRILLAVSGLLRDNILVVAGAVVAGIVAYLLLRRSEKGRTTIDRVRLRLPVLGPLMGRIAAARFATTLSTLYQSGIDTIQALEIAERVVGNAWMARAVRSARERVKQGESLAESLAATGGFQPLVVRMIRLGEQTGTLGEALDRANELYDREIPHTLKNVLNLLEPAMIVAAGIVVAFILVCTFLPIFTMVSTMGA